MKLAFCFFFTFILYYSDVCYAGWGYIDQQGWSKLHNTSCGGKKQSPIDLPDVCKKGSGNIVNPRMNLDLINYDSDVPASVMTLKNNGHTAVISFKDSNTPNAWTPKVSGSVLYGQTYQLLQLHFHWDKRTTHVGSEHGLHGKRLAFEMHLVHFNTKYRDQAEASMHPDGFAVLGTLFDNTDDDEMNNSEMNKIVSQLRQVSAFNTTAQMRRPVNLRKLLPSDIDTFYTYEGSLTTPPCSEIITWIIFPEIQKIGPNQLFAFERSLDSDSNSILDITCRDLQPLNQRNVYSSSDNHCRGKAARQSTALVSSGNSEGEKPQNPSKPASNNESRPKPQPDYDYESFDGYSRPPIRQRPQQHQPQFEDDEIHVLVTDGRPAGYRRPALVNGLVGGLLG